MLGFICIAGLLLVAFTAVFGQDLTTRLQQRPLNLQVPVLKQSRSTSCGEAVIAMVYNYVYPDAPITEQEVIDYALKNKYYTPGAAPFTSPANMVKIAENYTDAVSSGSVISARQGLALLFEHLRHGEPVIIDVLSDFRDPQSEAHFVVVTGLSVDPSRDDAVVIHYNDPLTGAQKADDWSGSQGVWNAWQSNGDPGGSGWWLVISKGRRP